MICDKLSECIMAEQTADGKVSTNINCKKRANCIMVSDSRSNIKCEENRKIYNLHNPQNEMVLLYKMDGGIIEVDASVQQNISKCDYLYITQSNKAILTELKGKDVKHALEQIDGTITLFRDAFKHFSSVYARVIVSSSIPRLTADPKYTKLLLKVKKMNGNLKIRENKMSERIDELNHN